MIRPSPEIEAIVLRWARSIVEHRVGDLPHLLSHSDALTYVGTSHQEVWRGQILRDGLADHLDEVPEIHEDEIEVDAWENGDTGWALYTCRFTIPDTGKTGIHRITFVFVMERGGWKIVQHHISQPDSNVEKLGIEHHALNDLVAAARDGFRLDQREGMASVMFTDIANSSAIAGVLGDRVWTGAVNDHFARIRTVIEGEGGQMVKSLGDGTMSSFASARSGLRAAVEIQRQNAALGREPTLALRIGLHTGDVIQTKDDFFGSVVNKAARIAAATAPGEIRVSEATSVMAGGGPDFRLCDPATVQLKGFEGEHLVYRLEWRA